MARRKKNLFDRVIRNYQEMEGFYYNRLFSLAMARFKWENLPESSNARQVEYYLCTRGSAIGFIDDVLKDVLILPCYYGGQFNLIGEPIDRTAYNPYGSYRYALTDENSVICWSNNLRIPDTQNLRMYARMLAELDVTLSVNAHALKTPILIKAQKEARLSLLNTYEQYAGNTPVIFADTAFDEANVTVLKTDAPNNTSSLYDLLCDRWNEAMSFLGIPNIAKQKNAHMLQDEVNRMQGGTIMSRNIGLEMRKDFCNRLNNLCGTKAKVSFSDTVGEEAWFIRAGSTEEGGTDV